MRDSLNFEVLKTQKKRPRPSKKIHSIDFLDRRKIRSPRRVNLTDVGPFHFRFYRIHLCRIYTIYVTWQQTIAIPPKKPTTTKTKATNEKKSNANKKKNDILMVKQQSFFMHRIVLIEFCSIILVLLLLWLPLLP